jgi:hypothetical protein
VRLTWERPTRSKELAGYYVYRSDRSGDGYRQIGKGPVAVEAFSDRPTGRGPWFYRVTAVEHSGLEGRPSDEIRVGSGSWVQPVRRYVEAELGLRDGLTDQFHGRASNMAYVELKDRERSGYVEMDVELPKAGRFVLWARVSGCAGRVGGYDLALDGLAVGRCEAVVDAWSWVRVLDDRARPVELPLSEGSHVLTASTSDRGAGLDKLLITDDAGYLPSGIGGEDRDPPAPVEGVMVETAGVSELDVTWEPVSDSDLHHYNVYSSTDSSFACDQSTLVASPSEPRWLDWGLPPITPHWSSTTYHYQITAVDRAGNESKPSALASGRTGVPRRW